MMVIVGYVLIYFFGNFPMKKGKLFEPNEMTENYIDANDIMADKAEVFFTKCLKEFFPESSNEKFLGEDLV